MKTLLAVVGGLAGWSAVCAHPALAQPEKINVAEIQKTLSATHAGWTAGENWVTRLPREQLKRMFGAPEIADDTADFTLLEPQLGSLSTQPQPLPAALDWRNSQGANWASPVLNQGNCGSCVAFATLATLETQINVTSGIPGLDPRLSAQALFACGGGSCDEGWTVSQASRYLKNTGVPDEACAPYTMGATGTDVACSSICPDASRRMFRILNYRRPTTGAKSIEAVKRALMNGPLVTRMTAYEDFASYSSGVYKSTTKKVLGGHAVSIVGYDSNQRAWVVRNSWGKDWGDQGYILISWDDTSGVGNETTGYEVPKPDGYVLLKNPKNRPYISGEFTLEAESTFKDTRSLSIGIFSATGALVQTLPCSHGTACTTQLDTRKLADGRYQAAATVQRASSERAVFSFYEDFYVLNGKPTLHLDFSPKDFSPSKPIKDRVEFDLVSHTMPVPLSLVRFHVEDQDGNLRYTRVQDEVAPEMAMGWRTTTLPNGTYRVWFSGEVKTNTHTTQVQTQKLQVEIRN